MWLRRLQALGPGLISGASDNDPTTVATLAVIGSTTTYALGWLVLLVIPLLAVVQAIGTHVGAVTKEGLEDLIRRRYGAGAAFVLLVSILFVNVLTLAADLEGGGAALQLLTHIDYRVFVLPLAAIALFLLIRGNFTVVERILVYVPLAFLAYVFAAAFAHPDWGAVLRDSFVPHMQASHAFVAGAIALLGTTLTAYAYVWQQIETAERPPPLRRLGLVQIDATAGAVLAGLTFWFIMVATGATLGAQHHPVQTAGDAAAALRPVAGAAASALFGVGLLGSALLALPVLLATSAYIFAEMCGWTGRLDSTFFQARRFYLVMIVTAAAACAIAFAGIAPIKLLFVASIASGIATPVSLAFMLLAASDKRIVKEQPLDPRLKIAGWATTGIVAAAAAIFLYQTATGQS
ncbi:MAG TPA: NRAMP family divalent metal transporter [Candidatus Baltobacteraceae bacterium]|nr:NRAMP family divalent metal transporter [Candidatus Baltobacteraceae bacterium]